MIKMRRMFRNKYLNELIFIGVSRLLAIVAKYWVMFARMFVDRLLVITHKPSSILYHTKVGLTKEHYSLYQNVFSFNNYLFKTMVVKITDSKTGEIVKDFGSETIALLSQAYNKRISSCLWRFCQRSCDC